MSEWKMIMTAEEADAIRSYRKLMQEEIKYQNAIKGTNKTLNKNKEEHKGIANEWQNDISNTITGLYAFNTALQVVKAVWQQIGEHVKYIDETQQRMAENTITQGNPTTFRIARQMQTGLAEARAVGLETASQMHIPYSETAGIIEAQSSMGMTSQMRKDSNLYMSASGFTTEQASDFVTLMDKLELDDSLSEQKRFMGQSFQIQQTFPTSTGAYAKGYANIGPVANAYKRDRLNSMVDFASAIEMRGTEDAAAELVRQVYRDVTDSKTGSVMAEYLGISELDYERQYNSTGKQFDVYQQYFREKTQTPEGRLEIKNNFEGRQRERGLTFFTEEAVKKREIARNNAAIATSDNFYNVLSPITSSQEYKASGEYAAAKALEFTASGVVQRGKAAIDMGKAVLDSEIEGGESLSWTEHAVAVAAAPLTFKSPMDLAGRAKERQRLAEDIRSSSITEGMTDTQAFRMSMQILKGLTPGSSAREFGEMIQVIEELKAIAAEGNRINKEIVEQQKELIHKQNENNTRASNPNRLN